MEYNRATPGRARVALTFVGLLFVVACRLRQSPDRVAGGLVSCLERGDTACATNTFHVPSTYSASGRERERETIAAMLAAAIDQLGPVQGARPGHSAAVLQVGVGSGDFQYWRDHPLVRTYVYDVTFSNNEPGQLWVLLTNVKGRWEVREAKFGLSLSAPHAAERIGNLAKREAQIVGSLHAKDRSP